MSEDIDNGMKTGRGSQLGIGRMILLGYRGMDNEWRGEKDIHVMER